MTGIVDIFVIRNCDSISSTHPDTTSENGIVSPVDRFPPLMDNRESKAAMKHGFTFLLPLLLLSTVDLRADQFVLFDTTFTFTKEDADNAKPSPSHYYVKGDQLNPDQPKNWLSPIDYRNGTVHLRLEVLEKPEGGAPTTWSVCYIPNQGREHGYGCLGTGIYEEAGLYEKDIEMTNFWQHDNIVWSEGIKEIHLVIKDDSGGKGHAHRRADHEKFFPTKIRMTLIQVSKGAQYDPALVRDLFQKP
jgi:hypothetical protein